MKTKLISIMLLGMMSLSRASAYASPYILPIAQAGSDNVDATTLFGRVLWWIAAGGFVWGVVSIYIGVSQLERDKSAALWGIAGGIIKAAAPGIMAWAYSTFGAASGSSVSILGN